MYLLIYLNTAPLGPGPQQQASSVPLAPGTSAATIKSQPCLNFQRPVPIFWLPVQYLVSIFLLPVLIFCWLPVFLDNVCAREMR